LGRGEADEGFAHDVRTDFVVEGTGGANAPMDEFKLVVVGGGVADRDPFERLFFGAGADIDPDLVNLGDLFAVGLVHQVNGAFAGDALDGAVGGLDDDTPSGDHRTIMAADGV